MRPFLVYLGIAAAGAVLGIIVLFAGFYDVSATDQHLQPTYRVLDIALREAVKRRGRFVEVPPLDDPALVRRGYMHFDRHCVQCHGAPGIAPEPFALAMVPHPVPLSATGRHWQAGEIFWVIKHGLKMTGMPAWEFRLSEDDLWAVVAFIRRLPALSPDDYRALARQAEAAPQPAPPPGVGNAERGKSALEQYACITCHDIPGVLGPDVHVGPPLAGIGTRRFIAGRLPNTRENMVAWLRHPQRIAPRSAMPDLGVTPRDAADMAAYLEKLK